MYIRYLVTFLYITTFLPEIQTTWHKLRTRLCDHSANNFDRFPRMYRKFSTVKMKFLWTSVWKNPFHTSFKGNRKKYNGENVRQLVHNYIRFDLHFFFSESQALSPSQPGGRFLEALGHRTRFVVQWRWISDWAVGVRLFKMRCWRDSDQR